MEAKLVFLSNTTGNVEQERSTLTSNSTQGAQKYLCRLQGSKGHYASNCRKPQVSSIITEYEKQTSKYLLGLQVVKHLHDGLFL